MTNYELGEFTERLALCALTCGGADARLTHYHERHDIDVVAGDRRIRVEVKGATSRPCGKNGTYRRFRANLHENQADVLVLCTFDDQDNVTTFVIPWHAICSQIVEITNDPRTYSGQWARYRVSLAALPDAVLSAGVGE